jgi:tetratricopeptide (TPR) repeat protein
MKKLILFVAILNTLLYAKPTMSQKSYDTLMIAQKFIEANEMTKAVESLNKLLLEKNDYAKSYAYQYLANIALQDNDYKKTLVYYENIIKLNSLDKENINRIKLSLSKIAMSLEKYTKSIQLSHELLVDSKISKTDIYETLIYSYYYTKKFTKSISYAKKYIAISEKKKETIYQILYSAYVELKNYKKAITTLNIMVRVWPKQQNYWLQLISLYQETKQYKKALSTIELSYKEKILDPKKNTQFYVNLLLQNSVYQKANLIMENGIKKGYIKNDKKTFELLISSYLNAKEFDKSIALLSKSKFAKNRKFKKVLANIYYNRHNYKSTIKVLKSIKLQKKSKTDADTEILMALCYFELNNIKESTKHLKKVLNTKKKKRAIEIAKALRINLKG